MEDNVVLQVSLELGGKNAAVVFDDADMAAAVAGVTRSFSCSGSYFCYIYFCFFYSYFSTGLPSSTKERFAYAPAEFLCREEFTQNSCR